jgi:signal transduction histidine kinase/FixJ family two-component response regulator
VKLDETVKNPLNKRGTFAIILGFIVTFSLTFTFFVSKIIRRQYIYEKNLEEVAQKAESASVAKSAFLANMSHEIRTPMNSIMGFSELAMDENITKEAITTYLWQIRKNSEWLLQIINDILDISKIEAGKIELESIPFDLDAIFNNCQMDIRHRVQDKGLALYCYAEPLADKILLGDPTRLRQIFTNFLSNSVKFTYIGIIRLSAKVKSTTDDTATITFEVKDSGIGMTPAQVQHVFEPFMQADSSTTRKYGGTGLGLPITKNMIELMGGKLLIDSAEGIGTKFNFEITFKTIAKDVGTTIKLSTDVVEKPNFKGTVLVFEDNKMNYNLIHDHLIRVGLDVVGVENGKIGVDLLKDHIKDGKQPFDLILMDMQMPVMDGLTAAEIISEMELKTPIVALTANVMVHDLENYQKKGIHDILGKPFTSQSLWQCLLKHLEPTEETHEQQTTELQPNSDNQIATKDDGFDDITRATLKKMFQTEIRDMYKNISNALNNDDISTAHRLAHTLKGNSALFNYQNLNEIAAVVEQNTSHNKNTLTATHLLTLEKELHTVLNQLDNELQ